MWSRPYQWIDPSLAPEVVTPGPKIFDENDQLVDDPDGSILAEIVSGNIKSLRSGIVVTADPVSYSGGYIRHSGSGYIYGADPVGSLRVESQLYGDGNWLQTAYRQHPAFEVWYMVPYTNPIPTQNQRTQPIPQARGPAHTSIHEDKSHFFEEDL